MFKSCAETQGCCLIQISQTPILCNTQNHYRYLLLALLYCGESVAITGSNFFFNLKNSLCLLREIDAKNQLSMQSIAHQKIFKSVKNMGCVRLIFLLPAVTAGTGFFFIFRRTERNSKSFLGFLLDPNKSFNKKTWSQQISILFLQIATKALELLS